MSKKNKPKIKKHVDRTPEAPIVTVGKTVSDSETYSKTVEIREKRIGIVFKVIYVVAIFFAAIFLTISESLGKGLSDAFIVECGIAAFLLYLLYRMVVYIFNELKCLKLNQDDVPETQIAKTEQSYSQIFSYFVSGGVVCTFAVMLLGYIMPYLTKNIMAYAFLVFLVLGTAMVNAGWKKHPQLLPCIGDMLCTLSIVCALVMTGWGVTK